MLSVIEHIDGDLIALAAVRGLMPSGGILLVTVPPLPALWSGFRVDFISPFITSRRHVGCDASVTGVNVESPAMSG